MRAYAIIFGLICAFIFGGVGAQDGFSYANIVLFILSLSVVAYAGLTAEYPRGGPISFDRVLDYRNRSGEAPGARGARSPLSGV